MTNITHKPIGEPDNGADRAELYKHVVAWYQSLPYEPGLGVRTWTVTPEEVVDLIDNYCQAQKAAQPQPLNDGELMTTIEKIGSVYYQFGSEEPSISFDLNELRQLVATHSPSTEAAVKDTKSCSLEAAALPDFAKPGGAIPYEEIRGKRYVDLDWLIKQLEQQRAALESVTTDEGDGA